MSQELYITYGAETLDFQRNGYKLLDGFYPETPAEGAESITERFDTWISASSDIEMRDKINAMRLAMEYAREHKDDDLAAYLHYTVNDTEDAWISKLLGGEIYYDAGLYHRWKQNRLKVSIVLEHKPYWDAQDEIQVPLTNGNGTNNTSGLTVYNHDDGGGTSPNHHDNWVEIAAADVIGDLLCPTRLEVLNNYATNNLYTLWIGQNWTDPANLTHIIEGESSTSGSEQSDGNCSGGKYRYYSLASGAEATMFTWALSAGFLNACWAQYYKFLARFVGSSPTQVKLRMKIQYAATTIWESGQVTLDASRATLIRDLFTFRLPPWLPGQTSLAGLSMLMTGQQNTGSPVVVSLDFMQVTALDGWRKLECAGYGVDTNERMMDDGFKECAYVDDGAGLAKAGILVGYGSPIHLYPGKKQRLYFLMHCDLNNTAEIARTISIKLFYRPRRKTL